MFLKIEIYFLLTFMPCHSVSPGHHRILTEVSLTTWETLTTVSNTFSHIILTLKMVEIGGVSAFLDSNSESS